MQGPFTPRDMCLTYVSYYKERVRRKCNTIITNIIGMNRIQICKSAVWTKTAIDGRETD